MPTRSDADASALTRAILVSLCVVIAAITWISTSTGVPEVYSPFPLIVILPAFLGVPIPVIAIASSGLFAGSVFRYFRGPPHPQPSLSLTIVLFTTTSLTALWIISGWSYGMEYQGASHTVAVTIANVLFAGIAWTTWLLAWIRGRYWMQVAFRFTLIAWMFWYALPYLGELP